MTKEQQLKLQALLDGELPEREAHEILAWTQRDGPAAALLAELKNTRSAVAQSEPLLNVPESRDFYWSKIERQIQSREPRTAAPPPPVFTVLRRWLLPAVAAGALVIAGFIAQFHATAPIPSGGGRTLAEADAPSVETTLANSDATTYRDASEGTTLVLFSYATDDGSTQNKNPTVIN